MRTFAAHIASLDCEAINEDDGVLSVMLAVEPGDSHRKQRICRPAAATFDRIAAQLGVELALLVPVVHGPLAPAAHTDALTAGPEPLPDTLAAQMTTPTCVLSSEQYPSFSASGTAHPTALQFHTFRGQSVPPDGQVRPDSEVLARRHLLDQSQECWTPEGLFIRDQILDLTREQALAVGAVPRGSRGDGPVPVQTPNRPAGTFDTDRSDGVQPPERPLPTYGVYSTPAGPQPELFVVGVEKPMAISAFGSLLDCAATTLSTLGLSLQMHAIGDQTVLDQTTDQAGLPLDHSADENLDAPDPADRPDDWTAGVQITSEADSSPVGWGMLRSTSDGWDATCAPVGRFGTTVQSLFARQPVVLSDALAPIQLRLLPERREDTSRATAVARKLQSAGVRVDLDARSRPVADRFATARTMGVPRIAVVGDEAGTSLRISNRRVREQQQCSVEQVHTQLAGDTGTTQYSPLYFDRSTR